MQLKQAASTYQSQESSTYPGKSLITLANQNLSNSSDLGGMLALTTEQDSLSSGTPIHAIKSRTHISQTYQRNLQGLRHINWNRNSPEFLLKQNFISASSAVSISRSAMFTSTNPALFNIYSIDGFLNLNGTINYWDPWYVNSIGNQPNTFRSISLSPSFSDSVFLNQTTYLSTYYSVSAPSPQTINGFNYYFMGWTRSGTSATLTDSTKDTTAVVFNSNNATVSAKYKGIHISGNSSAFANNSQHKFIQTPDGWLHMVYESGGHVWIEHSRDSGKTWQPNVYGNVGTAVIPVDTGGGGKCPSIDYIYYPTTSTVFVAYQQKIGNNYQICLASFQLSADVLIMWLSCPRLPFIRFGERLQILIQQMPTQIFPLMPQIMRSL